jgi:hypothetical protein
MGPPPLFTILLLRYMKNYGLTHEQLAMVSVVQREWAAKNPRAMCHGVGGMFAASGAIIMADEPP